MISRVSCQKGPTRDAYAWQIGPFWQDTFDIYDRKTHHWHTLAVFGETHQIESIITYQFGYLHDNVIKWKHFPRYWPFVRGIHRSLVNSLHEGQWRGALIFSLICVWINGWVNNRKAGDLRRFCAHYDVSVMQLINRCYFQSFYSGIMSFASKSNTRIWQGTRRQTSPPWNDLGNLVLALYR